MADKLAEAEELVKKAQKCMKTSFLKWSPDVDSAIDYYKKAIVIYRNLKKLQEAAELNLKIAELHGQNCSFFHCAKAYESAALLYRDLGDYKKVIDCLGTAGQIMRQNGVPDSATTLYSKGAKLLETAQPEDSARFYDHAAETSEVAISDTSDDATQTAYQVCGKAVVVLVIVKLIQEDSVAANKVYGEALEKYRFGETDDAMPVARLIQIYESYDSAAATEILSQPTFRNLETEFARLARTIKFPKELEGATEGQAGSGELEDIC
ncbi:unnamed protein product [Rodentolepis nana]|uniref:Gamma-soluble NSF attachment protein n=1 Tax=Rodentolepis nana TaxID=102285 RepID=A0A0R3T1X4_RODNA|nr:unnamed protein product [Rodentolepis nana]